MNAAVLVALSMLGDYGYEPLEDGGFAYIIQLTPDEAQEIVGGASEAFSEIPAKLRDVRTFRVQVGSKAPPRTGSPPRYDPTATSTAATTDDKLAGWEPASEGGYEYTIQLSPSESKKFLKGEPVFRDLPSWLHNVRRCFVVVGTERLPQKKRAEDLADNPKKDITSGSPFSRRSTSTLGVDRDDDADDGPRLGTDERTPATRSGRSGSGASEPLDRARRRATDSFPDFDDDDTGFSSETAAPRRGSRAPSRDDRARADEELDSRRGIDAPRRDSGFAVDDREPWPSQRGDSESRSRPASDATQASYDSEAPLGSRRNSRVDDLDESDSPSVRRERESTRRASEEKPWVPFTLAMLGLFASMGGNAFLGFLYWELREKTERKLRFPGMDDARYTSGPPSLRDDLSSASSRLG